MKRGKNTKGLNLLRNQGVAGMAKRKIIKKNSTNFMEAV